MTRKQCNRETWFKTLDSLAYMWNRKDKNHLWVHFLGYKRQEIYDAERKLMELGGLCITQDSDTVAGQTVCKFREPKLID